MNRLLEGITALDLSEYIAGPYCGSLLSDMGARVIKIEPPPCAPINYRANLYTDPQVQALDMMWALENEELGAYKVPGHPIRFSKTPIEPGKGTPVLGENSRALLAEVGYSEQEILDLERAGIVK